MKTFNEILKESSVTNNGIIIGDVKFYCRKSDSKDRSWGNNSPYYDLILDGPKGKRIIKQWACWKSGKYGGGMGPFATRSQKRYTINTACGFNGGGESISGPNPRETSTKAMEKTPQLKIWEGNSLKNSILKKYGEEYLDVGGDPSILDNLWDKYPFKSTFEEDDEF